MQIKTHYVLGLALAFSLVACGKETKTKTVTVENPKTVEALKAAEKERDELKEKLELVGDAEEIKVQLEEANAREAELKKSITDKNAEIDAAKKELEEARKNDDGQVDALEAKVNELEAQKAELNKDLEAAKSDKGRLEAQVETAQRDEELFKNLLDYAVAQGVKDRAAIGVALDQDIQAVEKALEALAGKKDQHHHTG
jgi:chromosome segregation ATPase